MRKTLIISIALCLISVPPIFGQTGLDLLMVEAGARPSGMGGAFTAVVQDPYSAGYNPAAAFGIGSLAASIGHNTYWENIRIETGYLSFQKKSITFSTGVQFAVDGNLQGRGLTPTSDYTAFDAHDISFKTGVSFEVDKDVVFGFMLGWMFEKIENFHGSAFNADIGLLTRPLTDLNVGFAVLNLGQKMKIREEEYKLPTAFRAGVSYRFARFLPAADIVIQDDDFHLHLGGEYKVSSSLFLRTGYRFGYDTKDFSAGAGFARRNLRIDYAFLPYKDNLWDSHLINLTFQL